ncbi:MAG TPA: indole-3-glycerol phosphate synthase TrpC [Nitriliruptorales bacterium]|nr:indole-3-glycerol phosphate synthase TrpC [Nitriliruptorales bacterium]
MATYLDELIAGARRRVADACQREDLDALRARASSVPPPPSLHTALSGPGVSVIAEVKRASPSRGDLVADLDAAAQAAAYRDGGAAAVSVLTEPDSFRGTLDDLAAVSALGIAALRKDFVVDPYQVLEARAAGAAAVLLIVAALTARDLQTLIRSCREAGVEPVVEVHDAEEARVAVDSGATTVGVNARDLHTFELDRGTFAKVRPHLPEGTLAVAESAIRGPDDMRAVALAGADAVLVGESLMRAADPRAAVALLVSAGAAPLTATEYR